MLAIDMHGAVTSERAALAERLLLVGPSAPAGATGWDAMRLIAHLVAQERWGGLPIVVATPLVIALPARRRNGVRRGLLERYERRLETRVPFEVLVTHLARPQPLLFRLPGLVATRLVETWVHHEDLRRTETGNPRSTDLVIAVELWAAVGLLSRRATPPAGLSVELRTPDGRHRRLGPSRSVSVIVTAEPGELLLLLMGRRSIAALDLAGEPGSVEAVEAATLL